MENAPGVVSDAERALALAEALQDPDVDQQWRVIHGTIPGYVAPKRSLAESQVLLDFAANTEASSSRFIRAYALEQGIQNLVHAENTGQPLSQDQQATLSRFKAVLPDDYFHPMVQYFARTFHTESYGPEEIAAASTTYRPDLYNLYFNAMTVRSAREDGVDTDMVTAACVDGMDVVSGIPLAPAMFTVDAMQISLSQHTLSSNGANMISPNLVNEATDILLDFKAPDFYSRIQRFREIAHLTRYAGVGGYEHDNPIEFLYDAPAHERRAYGEVFAKLYDSAGNLGETFAGDERTKWAVSANARELIAGALFAVQAHIQQGGHTEADIPIHDAFTIPVTLKGDEPLHLLWDLNHVLSKIHHATTAKSSRSVPGVYDADRQFQIDRYIDTETCLPPTVATYTRERGGYAFDVGYEYGRNGKGVAASISHLAQVSDTTPLPLNKVGGAIDGISIRLDHESDNAVALDIGSILGTPEVFGTKIGYLLAIGNMLRAQASGKPVNLNHNRNRIDQLYGQPEAFAVLAAATRERIAAQRATPEEFNDYVRRVLGASAGRIALDVS